MIEGLLLGFLMTASGSTTTPADDHTDLVEWFAARAEPLATLDPTAAQDDLGCLREMVGEARIVGLGEATHGTGDFFRIKHRMIRFLVEEMGFTHLAMEARYAEARAVDRYIVTGEGDVRAALAGLNAWTWNTEEVLALIEWMRSYNADPANEIKVRFFGVDMLSTAEPARQLLAYLEQCDVDFADDSWGDAEAVRALLTLLTSGSRPGPGTASEREQRTELFEILLERFEEMELDYIDESSEEEAACARQLVVVLQQALERGPERDQCMAENTSWLLETAGEDAKVMCWAHNAHIARNGLNMLEAQGKFLHEEHGADYVAFGFSFHQGEFQAMGPSRELEAFTVGPGPVGSLDAVLAEVGHQRAFFDLRGDQPASVTSWLTADQTMRAAGGGYSEQMETSGQGVTRASPAGAFDVWILADRTERARPVQSDGSD